MKITLYIRKTRNQKGYSQEYMASQLGMTIKTYARLERGEGKLTLHILADIARILEVSPYILFKVRINDHPEILNGSSPNDSKQIGELLVSLENQLNNTLAENYRLRRVILNGNEIIK